MARIHQWRKYEVAYNWVWDARFYENSNKYKQFNFSTDSYDRLRDCKIYQGYKISNGEFVLTNPKNVEDAVKGDVFYGYFEKTTGGDEYGYKKTPNYNVGEYYNPNYYDPNKKTLYKFSIPYPIICNFIFFPLMHPSHLAPPFR